MSLRPFVTDVQGRTKEALSLVEQGVTGGMQRRHNVTSANGRAWLGHKHDACGVIDGVILLGAAGAQGDRGKPAALSVHRKEVTVPVGGDLATRARRDQAVARVIQKGGLPTLGSDHLLELREAQPACQLIAHEAPADVHLSQTRQEDHGGRKLHTDVRKVLRSLAPERGHRLCDLKCIAYAVAQGPIHVGDEGHACAAHALPDGNHLLGKVQGVIKRLHEGTASARDVEQDPVGACRDLMMLDAMSGMLSTVAVTSRKA